MHIGETFLSFLMKKKKKLLEKFDEICSDNCGDKIPKEGSQCI